MGIHFNDLLNAAQSKIEASRGSEQKITIAERHKAEMADLVQRQAQEKQDNLATIANANASYDHLIAKLSADAGTTKKAIEEMVARQAALLIEAQVEFASSASIESFEGDGDETRPQPSPATAGAPAIAAAPSTGKRRGRKTNAEKAAEAAAAAEAAKLNPTQEGAEATPTSEISGNEVLTEEEGSAPNAATEVSLAPLEASLDTPQEASELAGDHGEGVEADAREDLDEGVSTAITSSMSEPSDTIESAAVTVTVVDSLEAPEAADIIAEGTEVHTAQVGEEVTSEPVLESAEDDFDKVHSTDLSGDDFAAAAPPEASADEDFDGFADLDRKYGAQATADASDEPFEVPSFVRR